MKQTNQIENEGESLCEHSYQFVEALQTQQEDIYKEIWQCQSCGDIRVLSFNVGVHGD